MENASKALIMAAGVLMGVLILSLAVYLFSTFRATADDNYKRMRAEEVAQFNSFYLSYDGRKNLTFYEVWSVVNKAQDFNKNDEENSEKISLQIKESDITSKDISIKDLKTILGEQHTAIGTGETIATVSDDEGVVLKKYTCKVSLNSAGRVNLIKFTETSTTSPP